MSLYASARFPHLGIERLIQWRLSSEEEQEDLSRITGALLVNIGTVNHQQAQTARRAGIAANARHRPVVLDPVGVGASTFRHTTTQGAVCDKVTLELRNLILNSI